MPSADAITLIASADGTRPAGGHAHHSASRAATIMLTRSAALEYGSAGIRVNTVSSGPIDRPGPAQDWPDGMRATPLGRLGESRDACVFLASPMARWITGHDLAVDGGMSGVPPW